MTRVVRRWVWLAVLLCPVAVFAQDNRRPGDDQPNAETLRRLAEQLAKGNPQAPPNIDPELMKLAQEYLKKNPDILKDPNFQQQVQQWQQQAKNDPNGFAEQFQQQNPNITPEQLQELKSKFQQSNPGGFTPPPNISPPHPTPNTGGTRPPIGDPPVTPPQPNNQGQPWQPSPPPGQQNPWQPNGQNGQNNPWKSAESKAQGKQEYQQVVGMWENNFGSIDKTPSLKGALVDMFSGEGKSPLDGSGGNGNQWNGGSGMKPGQQQKPWWDTSNNPNGGNQGGFVGWLKNTSANPPSWWKNMWNKPSVQPPNMNPGNGWTPPQYSGGGFNPGGGMSGGDLGSGALPIVIVVVAIVAAVAGFLIWRYWPQIQAKLNQPKPIPGLGPWTIDPRHVMDRESLVRAFEYLSVLICGDGARVWNHLTIADAFRENVPGAAPFADPLARLYALARYSPANEPIDPADIAEARGYLCRLAGVQA